MPKDLTAISLFSGGGGFDLGVARAGFRTRVTVDYEHYACETQRANKALRKEVAPGHLYLDGCEILEGDVRTFDSDAILKAARLRKGEADLLIGGPPCVTFSVAGKRMGLQHDMGLLYKEFVRVLRDAQPASFIFENVKGMLSANGAEGTDGVDGAFETILASLRAEGYNCVWRAVNAADYGIPQHRHRVFIIGMRNGEPKFPAATHIDPKKRASLNGFGELEKWRTVRDAISDLPSPVKHNETPTVANHRSRLHTEATIQSLAATLPGQRNKSYKRDRLHWDEPAKTIRAQGKLKANGSGQKNSSHQNIHPVEHRQLTVRESARIQTFPDWYVFDDSFVNGYRVVGDAVPPDLAFILAASVRRQLEANASPRARRARKPKADAAVAQSG